MQNVTISNAEARLSMIKGNNIVTKIMKAAYTNFEVENGEVFHEDLLHDLEAEYKVARGIRASSIEKALKPYLELFKDGRWSKRIWQAMEFAALDYIVFKVLGKEMAENDLYKEDEF